MLKSILFHGLLVAYIAAIVFAILTHFIEHTIPGSIPALTYAVEMYGGMSRELQYLMWPLLGACLGAIYVFLWSGTTSALRQEIKRQRELRRADPGSTDEHLKRAISMLAKKLDIDLEGMIPEKDVDHSN